MYVTRTIVGHECNCTLSKDGELREVVVMVGPPDKAGWRAKDGRDARDRRREVKRQVMEATGLPAAKVRIVSRFTSIVETESGEIVKRDDRGRTIGVFGGDA